MPHLDDIQLPQWVNWLAQDANGNWWGYSVEPLEHSDGWYENEVGKYILLKKSEKNSSWKTTLSKVPSK